MATTGKGFPYPLGTDKPNLNVQIQALAEAVDLVPGVATMTSGQIDALTSLALWPGRIIYQTDTGGVRTAQGLYAYNGSAWAAVGTGGGGGGAVSSVAGKTGAVTLVPADVPGTQTVANRNVTYAGLTDIGGGVLKVAAGQIPADIQGGTNTVASSGSAANLDFAYATNDITFDATCTLTAINKAANRQTRLIARQATGGYHRVTLPAGIVLDNGRDFDWDWFNGGETVIDVLVEPNGTALRAFGHTRDGFLPLGVGEGAFDRRFLAESGSQCQTLSGFVYFSIWNPVVTQTVTSILTQTISTGGWAGGTAPTACYVGLFDHDYVTGDLNPLMMSANTTSLWQNNSTEYTTNLITPTVAWTGRPLAVGALYVGTGTAPILTGTRGMIGPSATFFDIARGRISCASTASTFTAMPTSTLANANQSALAWQFYFEVR